MPEQPSMHLTYVGPIAFMSPYCLNVHIVLRHEIF